MGTRFVCVHGANVSPQRAPDGVGGLVPFVRGVMETDVIGGTDPLAARPRTYRCTAEEHATILELARAARMKVSGYLIACALNEGSPAGESLRVASEDERRPLLDRVRRIDECLGTLAKPLRERTGRCSTAWHFWDGHVAWSLRDQGDGAARVALAGPRRKASIRCHVPIASGNA